MTEISSQSTCSAEPSPSPSPSPDPRALLPEEAYNIDELLERDPLSYSAEDRATAVGYFREKAKVWAKEEAETAANGGKKKSKAKAKKKKTSLDNLSLDIKI